MEAEKGEGGSLRLCPVATDGESDSRKVRPRSRKGDLTAPAGANKKQFVPTGIFFVAYWMIKSERLHHEERAELHCERHVALNQNASAHECLLWQKLACGNFSYVVFLNLD